MKKTLALVLSLAMILCLSIPCFADDDITIGVAAYSMDEYGKSWADAFEDYAKTLGNIKVIMTNADASIDKQISDVDSIIAQKPDVIILRPVDADGLIAAVNACEKAGIPVIVSSYTVNCENYAAWIGTDQKDNGILQAEFLAKYLEENPSAELKVGYVWGTMGLSGCQDRYDGVAEWIETCDKAEIVSEKIGNWSVSDAMTIMEDWMQGMPEINTIICQNDEMACGVANALRAAGKDMDSYIILGIDGSENGKQYIVDGLIDGTIGTNPVAEAQQNVDLAIEVAGGATYDEPVHLNSYVLLTSENVEN